MSKRFVKKVGLIGGILFLVMTFVVGPVLAQKNGAKVEPNLYHVHTRVLWDVGWLTNTGFIRCGRFLLVLANP